MKCTFCHGSGIEPRTQPVRRSARWTDRDREIAFDPRYTAYQAAVLLHRTERAVAQYRLRAGWRLVEQ